MGLDPQTKIPGYVDHCNILVTNNNGSSYPVTDEESIASFVRLEQLLQCRQRVGQFFVQVFLHHLRLRTNHIGCTIVDNYVRTIYNRCAICYTRWLLKIITRRRGNKPTLSSYSVSTLSLQFDVNEVSSGWTIKLFYSPECGTGEKSAVHDWLVLIPDVLNLQDFKFRLTRRVLYHFSIKMQAWDQQQH